MMFPQEERNQRTPNLGTNLNRQSLKKQNNKNTINDLPEDQRAIAREVMEDADLSEAEYMKNYGKIVF